MKVVPIRAGQIPSPERCVISLGVGRNVYRQCLDRLELSLRKVGFQGDLIRWSEEFPEGCPDFYEAPFHFKTFCFFAARDLGYRQILWIDPPCVAIRSLEPIFQQINGNGYVMFNNNYGQTMGQWIGDQALAFHGLSREEALQIPEVPCSVLGLDLDQHIAVSFLEGWHGILADGITAKGSVEPIRGWEDYQAVFWNRQARISSDPRVKGHRCDQPAAGIVAHRLGMTPYADSLRDLHFPANPVNRHTAILHCREFGESITPLEEIYYNVFFRDPWLNKPRKKLHGLLRALRSSWSSFL